jgi:N-acetyl-anhydromuramyl-L-alanine amidase AmpD
MLDTAKLIQVNLKDEQYIKEESPKIQIVIHHTAGNSSPIACAKDWDTTKERIATAFVIGGKPKKTDTSFKDGDIVQCYSSKYAAYHLGLKQEVFTENGLPYKPLDKSSIGIELCNWGQLTKKADGSFSTYVNSTVPKEEVITLDKPFRGFTFFHAYTDAQIVALRDLLIYLCDKFNIPKTYNEDMWDISKNALSGTPGIWTHVSYRKDKVDVSPQPKLIAMLKTLEQKTL